MLLLVKRKSEMMKQGKIIIVQSVEAKITVLLNLDTNGEVWMTAWEIAELFDVFLATVGSNIRALFKSEEFYPEEVSCEHHHMNNGKEEIITYYNLNLIIALAFRLKSYRARQFREWIRECITEKFKKSKIIHFDTGYKL